MAVSSVLLRIATLAVLPEPVYASNVQHQGQTPLFALPSGMHWLSLQHPTLDLPHEQVHLLIVLPRTQQLFAVFAGCNPILRGFVDEAWVAHKKTREQCSDDRSVNRFS